MLNHGGSNTAETKCVFGQNRLSNIGTEGIPEQMELLKKLVGKVIRRCCMVSEGVSIIILRERICVYQSYGLRTVAAAQKTYLQLITLR